MTAFKSALFHQLRVVAVTSLLGGAIAIMGLGLGNGLISKAWANDDAFHATSAEFASHQPDNPYGALVSYTLNDEQSALNAFFETRDFRRITGLPSVPKTPARVQSAYTPDTQKKTNARLEKLNDQDQDTKVEIAGAQDAMVAEQVMTDLSGTKLNRSLLDTIEIRSKTKRWRCLAEALYFEARGESLNGMAAVAEVILNRVDSARYPDSVCSVIGQGESRGGGCQFSYRCDGKSDAIRNKKAYDQAGKIAWLMLHGKPRVLTDNALYYHNNNVRPPWAKKMTKTAKIGDHVFYRPKVKLSQR